MWVGQVRKISANNLMCVSGVSGRQYKNVQWHNERLIVKEMVDAKDFSNIVHTIIDNCSYEDDVDKTFLEFSIKLNIIVNYAFVDMPTDLDKAYYIVYQSDLYETILKNSNSKQIKDIIATVYHILGIAGV